MGLLVALASPAPPYDTDNSEMLKEKIVEKEEMLEQGKIVSLTPDTIENLPTATLTPTDISTAEDSNSDSFLEVVGYLAAIPLLAISPFLLLDPDSDGPGWIDCHHGASHLWHACPRPSPSSL